MLRVDGIIGSASDPAIGEMLHRLEHAGRIEVITLGPDDMLRKRLRITTDHGTECAIALPRDEALYNGAVIALGEDSAIVVRLAETQWLELTPGDAAAALELGYCAGNMHWRVQFAGPVLRIALLGPEADYLARLAPLIDAGRVRRAENG